MEQDTESVLSLTFTKDRWGLVRGSLITTLRLLLDMFSLMNLDTTRMVRLSLFSSSSFALAESKS